MATFGTFAAGQVLTAAELNAVGDWQTYTPALEGSTTDPTVSTVGGLYYEMNEIVIARVSFTVFTSAGSGTYYFTTPTDILADLFPIAYGLYSDGTYYPFVGAKSGTGARRVFMVMSHDNSIMNSANPITPGASTRLEATVIYRQA